MVFRKLGRIKKCCQLWTELILIIVFMKTRLNLCQPTRGLVPRHPPFHTNSQDRSMSDCRFVIFGIDGENSYNYFQGRRHKEKEHPMISWDTPGIPRYSSLRAKKSKKKKKWRQGRWVSILYIGSLCCFTRVLVVVVFPSAALVFSFSHHHLLLFSCFLENMKWLGF